MLRSPLKKVFNVLGKPCSMYRKLYEFPSWKRHNPQGTEGKALLCLLWPKPYILKLPVKHSILPRSTDNSFLHIGAIESATQSSSNKWAVVPEISSRRK